MANSNFEMTGKISLPKESDKFHPYTDTVYDSGWEKKRLMFNATCGDNSHLLAVEAGAFSDGHGEVYTFTKGSADSDGKKIKGELIKIPFKDRLTSKRLPEIAEFKKFIIDLESQGRRYKLENFAEKIKDGTSLTDNELKEVGLENESQVSEALEKSNKKRHEFISEWDFVDFIKKVLDSGKYADKKFFIRGNIVHTYSDSKQKVYQSYVPTRIYLASDDAEENSTATFNLLYGADAVDTMSVGETGKYFVNGYIMSYDNNRKSDIPVATTIVIPVAPEDADEKAKKKVSVLCKKFEVDDDTYKELGVVVDMLNGAQKTEITEDMLTDEQKEDLECGLIEMKDIIKEMGGSVYGERVQEYRFNKIARGFSKGRNDSIYTADDMIIKPIKEEGTDETEDLFKDEDDDEL